jgi:stalled ribosome rescue protein Dom34
MHSKNNVGLWIDHRRAVIVRLSDGEPDIREVLSHADRQPSRADGVRSTESHESLLTQADDVTDRKFYHQLNTFYDAVIGYVHDAQSLLVMGPGEAKGELIKRIEAEKPSDRRVNLETADKLTNRQIVAYVKECFEPEASVLISR